MSDPAFKFDIEPLGLKKWRIEALKVVECEVADGKFYSGDAYIVLHSVKKGAKIEHHLHFWIGDECSQDESGIAAYKSVECDDALGGKAVQFREMQGNESDEFLSVFKDMGGVEYLDGGIESGFAHVERDTWPVRLLHVKGKYSVRVKEVPVAAASLTKGDVYILDNGFQIYIYLGSESNRNEKKKGFEVARHINSDSRGGRAEIINLDEQPKNVEFWEALGSAYIEPSALPVGEPDSEAKEAKAVLLRMEDNGNSSVLHIDDVPLENGVPQRKQLETGSVYLLIVNESAYIWVGKSSSPNEKKEGSIAAAQALKDRGLNPKMKISRVSEGVESGEFRACFPNWNPPVSIKHMSSGVAPSPEEKVIDVAALLARQHAQDLPVDDGSGKVAMYSIKDFKLAPVDDAHYGQFYAGDAYVISYQYKSTQGRDLSMVFFWIGHDCTADEKGGAALLAKEMDDNEFNGAAVQIRVTQGKEPSQLSCIFKNQLIIHSGGKNSSGFANVQEQAAAEQTGPSMYHIKGTNEFNTRAVQVPAKSEHLNSGDVFVIVDSEDVYVWIGKHAVSTEKDLAVAIAGKLSKSDAPLCEQYEGTEKDQFWTALGGKSEYPETGSADEIAREPRLFEGSTKTGTFTVEEIPNFCQEDLSNDEVYLLDTYTQLFVWVGGGADREEKEGALVMAEKFSQNQSDGRESETPIIMIAPGAEPAIFVCHFLGWDAEFLKKQAFTDPYKAQVEAIRAENEAKAAEREAAMVAKGEARAAKFQAMEEEKSKAKAGSVEVEETSAPAADTDSAPAAYETARPGAFTLDQLRGPTNSLSGVEPHEKEKWLSDSEFQTVFAMTRSDFEGLAKWKKDGAKKKCGLF